MTEDMAEPLLPDRPESDMLVPVKPAPEFTLAVVEVDDPQVLKANQILKLPEHRIDRISRPEVVAGGKGMTGVKAETDSLTRIDPLPYREAAISAPMLFFLPAVFSGGASHHPLPHQRAPG